MMSCAHDRRWCGPSFVLDFDTRSPQAMEPHPRQFRSITASGRGEGALVLLFCHLSFLFSFLCSLLVQANISISR